MRPLSCKMAYGHGRGMLTTSRLFGGKNIYLLFIDIKYFYYMRWYRIFEHHVHRRAFQRWEHTGHVICHAETKPAFPPFPAATLSRCPRVLLQPNRFLHPNTSLFVSTALCKLLVPQCLFQVLLRSRNRLASQLYPRHPVATSFKSNVLLVSILAKLNSLNYLTKTVSHNVASTRKAASQAAAPISKCTFVSVLMVHSFKTSL